MKTDQIASACLVAGELAGTAFRLDENVLQEYLDSNPKDFPYGDLCLAAIAFKKAILGKMAGADDRPPDPGIR